MLRTLKVRNITFLIKKMLYSIENVEDLQKLNELVSLQIQVQEIRLQNKLGEQNYHEDIKKILNQ